MPDSTQLVTLVAKVEDDTTSKHRKRKRGEGESDTYAMFLKLARETCTISIFNGEPKYSEQWLKDNADLMLAAFGYGYSSKAVASIFGITWSTWKRWVFEHDKFRVISEMAESLQLLGFEQMRNDLARGERNGSTAAALSVIDRLHSDVYFGKPGLSADTAIQPSEINLNEAIAILEEAGVDIDDI